MQNTNPSIFSKYSVEQIQHLITSSCFSGMINLNMIYTLMGTFSNELQESKSYL